MRFLKYILLIVLAPIAVFSQTDSLIFINENVMVGEIKSMDRGVVQIETDYSDSDFKIEWEQIKYIHTNTLFYISLTDESQYYGTLRSSSETKVVMYTIGQREIEVDLIDIVFLAQLKKSFWDRLYASIDFGIDLTKANDFKKFTSRSTIGYRAHRWSADATYNTLNSTQTNADPIERSDGTVNYRYNFSNSWYAIPTFAVEANTELKLDLRVNAKIGFGRYFWRTNNTAWGINLGANRNIERYSNETPDRDTWEGFISTELDLFDIGDLSLFTRISAFPGITEKKRLRSDITLDTKYDLPLNLYFKIGMTVNYDNQPAEGASETDYVFQTGFGWEW